MTEPNDPTSAEADVPDRPTLATPGPAVMRETLASARRRLVHDDLTDDLPRTAAELRAALRDAALPASNGSGQAPSRRSTASDRVLRPPAPGPRAHPDADPDTDPAATT